MIWAESTEYHHDFDRLSLLPSYLLYNFNFTITPVLETRHHYWTVPDIVCLTDHEAAVPTSVR